MQRSLQSRLTRKNDERVLFRPLLARIIAEENLLRAQFGDEYNAYCSHTWRLILGLY